MVDLVKIRKKAKRKDGEQPMGEGPSSPPPPAILPGATPDERPSSPAVAPPPRAAKGKAPREGKSAGESLPRAEGADSGAAQQPEETAAGDTRAVSEPQRSTKLSRFLETAGQRRIIQAVQSESATAEQVEVLTFSIAGELYAVTIDSVVEIVTPRSVTHIPNSDPSIVGILSLRGLIVTLIDVRRRLGHPGAAESSADERIVVVQLGEETLGFPVDRVLRVVRVDAAAVSPHPVAHSSEQDECVRGVFRHGDALTILLDLDKLLGGGVPAASPS